MRKVYHILLIASLFVALVACRTDEVVIPVEYESIPADANPLSDPIGMYLLNEGNMGSNKATIDYIDFKQGVYARNLYAERNPAVIKELGDVGNDIAVYGSKLYAVINSSHKVEVMDAASLVRIGQIDISNCRYICFDEGYAYVSAYVGPISINPNAQHGAVYKVDTTSLKIVADCMVGYQPEELAVVDDYIFVANSGGYLKPYYDNTLSVVDKRSMQQVRKIAVAPNLHRVRKDAYDRLWVSSRGNEADIPSRLMLLEVKGRSVQDMCVTDTLDVPCSNMWIDGDRLFFYSLAWSDLYAQNQIGYGVIDVRSKELISDNFITDGSDDAIERPYGVAVNPANGDIYVTDARNYVSSGVLHCYSSEGKKKWSVRTGDIPAHMVFINKENL